MIIPSLVQLVTKLLPDHALRRDSHFTVTPPFDRRAELGGRERQDADNELGLGDLLFGILHSEFCSTHFPRLPQRLVADLGQELNMIVRATPSVRYFSTCLGDFVRAVAALLDMGVMVQDI